MGEGERMKEGEGRGAFIAAEGGAMKSEIVWN